MSALHHIYAFIESLSDDQIVPLPHSIADELLACAMLLPCAVARIGDPISNVISATDATPVRGGTCRATTTPVIAKSLYRLCEMRGEHGRLDWSQDETASLPTSMRAPSSAVDDAVRGLWWERPQSWAFREASHINLGEARALKKELRALASNVQHHRSRRVFCLDSRVVIGAWAKGRSSSFRLNGIIRSCIGLSLLSQICGSCGLPPGRILLTHPVDRDLSPHRLWHPLMIKMFCNPLGEPIVQSFGLMMTCRHLSLSL